MPKWIISLFIGTIITVTGQSPLARFTPFVVGIQQQIPVEVALTIPTDDGDITTTVPLTLGINLQINVTGPYSASVSTLGDALPDVRVTTIDPARAQTDDLDFL